MCMELVKQMMLVKDSKCGIAGLCKDYGKSCNLKSFVDDDSGSLGNVTFGSNISLPILVDHQQNELSTIGDLFEGFGIRGDESLNFFIIFFFFGFFISPS